MVDVASVGNVLGSSNDLVDVMFLLHVKTDKSEYIVSNMCI